MILPSHKIEIEKAILNSNLKKSDFIRQEDETSLTLTPRQSQIFFKFSIKEDGYHVFNCQFKVFSPKSETTNKDVNYNIHDIIKYFFNHWLKDHAKVFLENVDVKDPWESPSENADLSFSNAKFDDKKIKQLGPKIDIIKFQIENLNLERSLQDQLNKFANELTEIKEELKNLKRKNWVRQFIGWGFQLTTFASNHAPEKLQEIKEIINVFFDQFNQDLIA
jgi:hypothetical protein